MPPVSHAPPTWTTTVVFVANRFPPIICSSCGTPTAGTSGDDRAQCGAPLEPEGSATERPPAPPSTLAGRRYEAIALLGEGTRKRVSLRRDTRLDREVRSMARLGDHPNILTIHDAGEHGGQLVDAPAKGACRRRVENLREEIETAHWLSDSERLPSSKRGWLMRRDNDA